jgi:lipopolysaccharide transport system permease protein
LVFAAIGQSVVDLLVRLVIVGLLLAFYGVAPRPASLLFPLPLLALLLFTLGLGLLLSLLNAILRDISKVLTPILTFLLFVTPVLYPAPEGSMLAAVSRWNPVSQLVTSARDMLLLGELSSAGHVLAAVVFSLLVFGVGLRLFHLLECRIAERI